MNTDQTKIIELLREVHLLAIREVERLNLRITELENESRRKPQSQEAQIAVFESQKAPSKGEQQQFVVPRSASESQPEMIDERQVSGLVKLSLSTVRRWRRVGNGPKFLKIGTAVRYRRSDVEAWLNSRAAD